MGHIWVTCTIGQKVPMVGDDVTSTIGDERFVMVGTLSTMEIHQFVGYLMVVKPYGNEMPGLNRRHLSPIGIQRSTILGNWHKVK